MKKTLNRLTEMSADSKFFCFLKARPPSSRPAGICPGDFPGSRSPPVKANEFGFRARTLATGPPGICSGDFSGSRSPPLKANEFGLRARTLAAGPPSSRPARRAPGLQMPPFGTFSRAKSPFCSERHISCSEYGTKEEPTGGKNQTDQAAQTQPAGRQEEKYDWQ